jgi:hypothetical protein
MSASASTRPQSLLWRILDWGAVTPIGTSAWQSAASWVSGQRRFRKAVQPQVAASPLTTAECREVSAGLAGRARLAALLRAAMLDMVDPAPGAGAGAAPHPAHTQVLLSLPLGLGPEDATLLWQECCADLPANWQWLGNAPCIAAAGSNATGYTLLQAAQRQAAQDPDLALLLLAGVDSLVDVFSLKAAFNAGTLLTDGHTEGFIPGEAAACVLLGRATDTRATDERALFMHPVAVAQAAATRWPSAALPDGAATATALSTSMQAAGMQAEHMSHVLCDMDGSEWRAVEQSHARIRALELMPPTVWEPASSLGQVGAATVPLYLALAAQRCLKDRRPPNTVLTWVIEAGVLSGAAVLERAVAVQTADA